MKAVPNEDIISKDYLFYLLKDPIIQNIVIKDSQRSAGQSGVNKDLLNSIKVLIPSVETQETIIRYLKQEFDTQEFILKNVNNALKKIKEMRKSLLQKAFRGELVKQQPEEGIGQELFDSLLQSK